MNIFNESTNGFMWGLGFALSTVLIYTGYGMYLQAGLQFSFKNKMNYLLEEQLREQESLVRSEVIDFKIFDNGVKIASKTNSTSGMYSSLFRLKFTLMQDGEFSGICYQDLDSEKTSSDFSYYQTLCTDTFLDFNNVTDINVTVVGK